MPSSPSTRPSPPFSEKYGHLHASGGGSRRKSGLRSRGTQLLALRFGWVVLVIWFEVGEFFHSLSSCKFPDAPLRPYTPRGTTPAHIVLVADPHVPHPILSHPADSPTWLNALRQAFDELFMRKSWNVVMRLGRIDGVIMLGDMLDTGRGLMTDEDYDSYYNLYSSIFTLPSNTPIHHVPGNHDIPLGPFKQFSQYARERYTKHFSSPNEVISIANHSIVLLDSVGLVEEDYRRYASEMQFGEWDGVEGGVIEFVKSVGDMPVTGPRILISHIPLARPENARCGQYREHGRIQKGAGPGYQNLLGSETSRFLLEELQPSIVFSGDDHDYCEYTHSGRIREVTLKSFSSSTGIKRPGFQLLSLVSPEHPGAFTTHPTLADRPCFLPDQSGVYTRVYFPLVVITFLFLFGTNVRGAYRRWQSERGEKSRSSPFIGADNSGFPRRVSDRDRPVPLTLPSRRSSAHLSSNAAIASGSSASRGMWRVTSRQTASPEFGAVASVPPSPMGSPRPSFSLDRYDDDVSTLASPAMSRRSSFIYMSSSRDAERGDREKEREREKEKLSVEPGSYFLPLPSPSPISPTAPIPANHKGNNHSYNLNQNYNLASPSNAAFGGQASQPNSPLWRRTSHSNLTQPQPPQRRVTMPRLASSQSLYQGPLSGGIYNDGRRTPGPGLSPLPAPVLSLEHGPHLGSGLIGRMRLALEGPRGFARSVWRARDSVFGRSMREVWAVFWVAGVVWFGVNALFFWV